MFFNLFKKKTREEQIEKRTESVFAELTSTIEFEFTDSEIVQILNNTRRRLSESLKLKKSESMEQSIVFKQKEFEIQNALNYID